MLQGRPFVELTPNMRNRRQVVRRLAFDRTLPAAEAMGRIRDAYHDYDKLGGIA
jgi:hypothetical protein